jgi:hypothetical protein
VNARINNIILGVIAVTCVISLFLLGGILNVLNDQVSTSDLQKLVEVGVCLDAVESRLSVAVVDLDKAQTDVLLFDSSTNRATLQKTQDATNKAYDRYVEERKQAVDNPNAFVDECKARGDIQ